MEFFILGSNANPVNSFPLIFSSSTSCVFCVHSADNSVVDGNSTDKLGDNSPFVLSAKHILPPST